MIGMTYKAVNMTFIVQIGGAHQSQRGMIDVVHERGLDERRQSVRRLRRIYHRLQEDRHERLDFRVADDLAELLEGDPREVVVEADNDGVGRAGAGELARALGSELLKDVRVMQPPPGFKDYREFIASFLTKGGPADGR